MRLEKENFQVLNMHNRVCVILISLGVSENVHCVAWLVLSVIKSTWLGLTVPENVHFVAWLDLSVSENVHFVARLVSLCQKLDLRV